MKQFRRGDLSGTPGSLGRTAALAALCASVTVCDRSSAAPLEAIASSLRFGVDHAAHVRQYDPVFQKPITEGGSGVPIGNGDLAAVVWEPDDLTIMLNKCDLGGTSQAARVRFITPTAKRLADRVGRLTTHLSLFDATATITYEGGKLPESAGWMWRGRSGAAPPPADEDLGTLSVVSYVPNGRNVLIVRYEEEPKAPHPVRIVLDRWVQKQFGDNVQAQVIQNALGLSYQVKQEADASDYAVALAFDGFQGASLEVTGPQEAALNVPASGRLAGRLAVAVVTAAEAADPLAAALELARASLALPESDLVKAHQAYWASFWDRFFVDGGHPYLTALYHVALYELGITSRGTRPVKFNGALNLWNEHYREWGSPFWCHNQSEVYLPVYAANHAELADNFHEWIVRVHPEARKAARKFFQVQGAYYPETMAYDFHVPDPDTPSTPSGIGWILSSGVRYALLLWNRYQYTLDESFLKEKAYPVIRDCADFYANYGKPGGDGLYHVEPAMSWEEPPLGRDSHADCAAWRAIFPIAIEVAAKLGVDDDRIAVWEDRLAKAPPYPVEDGCFSVVTRDDGTPEPTDHFQWQLPNLSGVFPYGVIGIESDPGLKSIALNTFERYRYNADAGHEFLPVVAARLGLAQGWRSAMFNFIQFFQVYDQGLFHYYNIHGSRTRESGNTAELHPYLESSGIMATAVNEMLLQSHGGTIRVFPALPPHWPARFILRAAGSFLVASEHRGPEGIAYIAVLAVGGPARACRVAIPWSEGADLTLNGNPRPLTVHDGAARFDALPDQVFILTPKGRTLEQIPMIEVASDTRVAPCRFGNVWIGSPDGPLNHTSTFPLW